MLFLDKPIVRNEVFLAQNEGVDSVISFGGCGCPGHVRNGNPVCTLLGSELQKGTIQLLMTVFADHSLFGV